MQMAITNGDNMKQEILNLLDQDTATLIEDFEYVLHQMNDEHNFYNKPHPKYPTIVNAGKYTQWSTKLQIIFRKLVNKELQGKVSFLR